MPRPANGHPPIAHKTTPFLVAVVPAWSCRYTVHVNASVKNYSETSSSMAHITHPFSTLLNNTHTAHRFLDLIYLELGVPPFQVLRQNAEVNATPKQQHMPIMTKIRCITGDPYPRKRRSPHCINTHAVRLLTHICIYHNAGHGDVRLTNSYPSKARKPTQNPQTLTLRQPNKITNS